MKPWPEGSQLPDLSLGPAIFVIFIFLGLFAALANLNVHSWRIQIMIIISYLAILLHTRMYTLFQCLTDPLPKKGRLNPKQSFMHF